MVDLVTSLTRGGQLLPDNVDTAVRSNPFGAGAVMAYETAASAGRSIATGSSTQLTLGASPYGSTRYDTRTGEISMPGTGGGTGTPLSSLAGSILTHGRAIVAGVVALIVVYVLGQLITINLGGSG